jgi:hypothetical protein
MDKKISSKVHVNKAINSLITNLIWFEVDYVPTYGDEWLVVLRFTDKTGKKRAITVVDSMMAEEVRCSVE